VPLRLALLLLLACETAASPTDAGGATPVDGGAPAIDAHVADAFVDPETDAGPPLAACSDAEGRTICDDEGTRCGVVFDDGSGCDATCRAMGRRCVQSYENVEGECALDDDRPALGCAETGHGSDYCVCDVAPPGDAGVADTRDAGTMDVDAGPSSCPAGPLHVYLVGDSTVASGTGWGDALSDSLRDDVAVHNHGRGGRSSKSYWDEGAFDAVRDALAPGDLVFVQFGHNDAKPDAARNTDPGSPPDHDGTYRAHLELYLEATRAVGATPVLVTSVSRMVFRDDGSLARTHGDYPDAMRATARANDVALLDLEEESYETFSALGEEETLALYSANDGADLTHFPPDKAWRVAAMVADLVASETSLSCLSRDP